MNLFFGIYLTARSPKDYAVSLSPNRFRIYLRWQFITFRVYVHEHDVHLCLCFEADQNETRLHLFKP